MVFMIGFAGVGIWDYASSNSHAAAGASTSGMSAASSVHMPSFMDGTEWKSRSLLDAGEVGLDGNASECHDPDPFTAAITSCDYETSHSSAGFAVLYVFIVYNIFLGIAILCDDYFLGALEGISEALDLSEDVAGATFMAAGSSAPELFTALAGVAMGHAETGAGTIVGSAVFNILVIIALSVVMVPDKLEVDWRCIFRDGSFYGISIVLFIIFAYDSVFELYEAIILLVMYALYVFLMYHNQKFMNFLQNCCGGGKVAPEDNAEDATAHGNDIESVVELEGSEDQAVPEPGEITVSLEATSSADAGGKGNSAPRRASSTSKASGPAQPNMVEMKELSKSLSALKQETAESRPLATQSKRLTKGDLVLPQAVEGALAEPTKIQTLKKNATEYFSSSEPDLTKIIQDEKSYSERHSHFHHKYKKNLPWSSHAVGAHAPSTPPGSFKKRRESSFARESRKSTNGHVPSSLKHSETAADTGALVIAEQPNVNADDQESTAKDTTAKDAGEGDNDDADDDDGEFEGSCGERCCFPCVHGDHPDKVCGAGADPEKGCLSKLSDVYTWFNFVLGAPYQWAFRNTIPYARYYWLSFAMNILWIIVFRAGVYK